MANPNPLPFKKTGAKANPNGRPKAEWTWRGEILKALERKTLDGTPMKQGVAEALLDKALQGDVIAIREIGNRIDGMPKQSIDQSTTGELKVIIEDYGGSKDKPTTQAEGSSKSS